jgi:ubiquitin carboxyl-terminal hydrolase MINDY-1/2
MSNNCNSDTINDKSKDTKTIIDSKGEKDEDLEDTTIPTETTTLDSPVEEDSSQKMSNNCNSDTINDKSEDTKVIIDSKGEKDEDLEDTTIPTETTTLDSPVEEDSSQKMSNNCNSDTINDKSEDTKVIIDSKSEKDEEEKADSDGDLKDVTTPTETTTLDSPLERDSSQKTTEIDIQKNSRSESQIKTQNDTSTQLNDSKTRENNTETNYYNIKWINFKDNSKNVPIIMQNKNGPCPLIAIANILLLRQTMTFNPNKTIINGDELIQYLVDTLFNEIIPKQHEAQCQMKPEMSNNLEHNIDDALKLINSLQNGLDVNVKFTKCDAFEYTKELNIFDLFNIQLLHGWIAEEEEVKEIIQNKSYNQCIEIVINNKNIACGDNVNNIDYSFMLIEQFLERTSSQLTYSGLTQLYEMMRSDQLAVLFRNNHFSVVYKDEKSSQLYTLLTGLILF